MIWSFAGVGSAGADDFIARLAPDRDPMVVVSIAAGPISPAVNFRTPGSCA